MITVLPNHVYEAVARHLRTAGQRAHRSWEVNQAHEDSLTGAAFVGFHTQRTRRVYVDGQEWHWRVRARKFGSGGRGSEERRTGADGVVEVEVRHPATGTLERKALLIQAKREWAGTDSRLLEQVRRMENVVEGCSVAVNYSAGGYSAVEGRAVLVAEGNRSRLSDGALAPLGEFLADRFLACRAGVRGLYYDPRRKLLHLPQRPEGPDAIAFVVPERLRIEIEEIPRQRA